MNRRPIANAKSGARKGRKTAGAIVVAAGAGGPEPDGRIVGRIVCPPPPPFVGLGVGGPPFVGVGPGVGHGSTTTPVGSGVGGPPPGSHGTTAEQTSVGANLPPQVRPKGTRKPSKK